MSIKSVEKEEAISHTLNMLRMMKNDIDPVEFKDEVNQLEHLAAAMVVLNNVKKPGYLVEFLLQFMVFAINSQHEGFALSEATMNSMTKMMNATVKGGDEDEKAGSC